MSSAPDTTKPDLILECVPESAFTSSNAQVRADSCVRQSLRDTKRHMPARIFPRRRRSLLLDLSMRDHCEGADLNIDVAEGDASEQRALLVVVEHA